MGPPPCGRTWTEPAPGWVDCLPWFRNGHYLTRSADGEPVVRPVPDGDLAQWPIQSQILDLDVATNGDAKGTLQLKLPGMFGRRAWPAFWPSARPEQQKRQMQACLASVMPRAQLENLEIMNRPSPARPAGDDRVGRRARAS